MLNPNISAVILAGGLGTRMNGAIKAFLEVGGVRIIDRLLETLRPLFSEIIIAARDLDTFKGLGTKVVQDQFESRSSLAGIHAGLDACSGSHAFVVACDAPLVQAALIRVVLDRVTQDTDVVIPLKNDGFHEPLCAAYSKTCLPFIADQLKREDFKIIHFFDHISVTTISENVLRKADPNLVSFSNVNTPEELKKSHLLT